VGEGVRESRKEGAGNGIPKVAGSRRNKEKLSRENVFSYILSSVFGPFFPFFSPSLSSSSRILDLNPGRSKRKAQNDPEKPMEMVSYRFHLLFIPKPSVWIIK